ncbi:hypothetical protein EON65_24815 [archaeon]|nr:MAG: hypothetical protein EON65_24815 [archaeon]
MKEGSDRNEEVLELMPQGGSQQGGPNSSNNLDVPSIDNAEKQINHASSSSSAMRNPYLYYTIACCCPGFLLGNITTKLHRELPFACFDYACCSDYQLGVAGCQTCGVACLTCLVGWPASPCLAYYLQRERWKLRLFYKDDDRLKPGNMNSCLNWPRNLKEQHEYVCNVYREGMLTFAWDYALYGDMIAPPPEHISYTVMVFGPSTKEEKEFLRKLILRVDYRPTATFSMYDDLTSIEKIKTGIKPLSVDKDGNVRIMELWEIPPSRHRNAALNRFLAESNVILYVFDLNTPSVFAQTKEIFHLHAIHDHCSKIIIILKPTDPGQQHSSLAEEEIVAWARKTSCIWFVVSLQFEQEILKIGRELDKLLLSKKTAIPDVNIV